MVGVIERQSIDKKKIPPLVLLRKLVAYFEKWEPILRAKGCYDKEVKIKASVRAKKKSLR